MSLSNLLGDPVLCRLCDSTGATSFLCRSEAFDSDKLDLLEILSEVDEWWHVVSAVTFNCSDSSTSLVGGLSSASCGVAVSGAILSYLPGNGENNPSSTVSLSTTTCLTRRCLSGCLVVSDGHSPTN